MSKKAWIHIVILLVSFATLFLQKPTATCFAAHINVIRINDTINPGVQDYLENAIEKSRKDGAEFLLILLDTPGGLMTSMRKMVQAIMSAPFPVVVYVYPPGAQAASAGVLITVAADVAAMAPGTNIGAAHPVTATGGNVPEAMNEKIVNDMVALAKSIAEERFRNAEWLEKAIRKSVSATATEAYKLNVVDLIAADVQELLEKLDGWEIERKGYRKVLHTKNIELREIRPSIGHKILKTISNPTIAYILLMIGLAGLYFELSQPGVVLPGIIGAISLVLAFYALQTLPVNYAGILFLILAVLCFILEIKVTSYGMLSVAGTTCLVLGSIMLFRTPESTQSIAYSVLVPVAAVTAIFFASVATLAYRAQRMKPKIGMEALVGEEGTVVEALDPEGKVFVNGELWNAVAPESIPEGSKVRVVGVKNLKLHVEKIGVR
ncbi:MAG: nodulation protein NfeD [Deltaproteobacteria bacterium]|nr:nodulation protein NfeD [Deltaproteobacteria bacterium]MBW2067514.1 nodulation protein NfeD [Deltaproteobacteria bacterium]